MRFGALIVGSARRGWFLAVLGGLAVLAGVASASAATLPSRVRVGAAPREPARSHVIGALPSTAPIQINVTLKPSDPAGLASYAAAVSTPGSSLYHRYLSVSQFRRRFGPSSAEIAAVEASLKAHGLMPGAVSANGLAIPVSASAARIARAFSVSFDRVALPSGRTAFANTRAPQFDSSVASGVQSVVGLDSLSLPAPQLIRRPRRGRRGPRSVAGPAPNVVTGGPQACSQAAQSARSNYAYTADQLASAYQFSSLYGAGDQGAGQTIALFELEPNSTSDIAAYQSCYGTSTSVNYVSVDGGVGSGAGSGEAALDIEDVIGLAPRANVLVYQGPNTGSGAYDTYAQIVSDDRASVISTSWGLCEAAIQGTATAQAENTLFQEAAVQGQSVFAAAGDNGSEDCQNNSLGVDDPASQPYVTGVGGTTMTTAGPPPTESVWNESANGAGAGGGGISTVWTMPSYQSGAPQSLNVINAGSSGAPCGAAGGGHCRQVPDVSAVGDPYTGYLIYYNGSWSGIGGTSAAAPLWAAFMALTNASSACAGTPVGFANPALYSAAASGYATSFGDIVAGNNDYTGTNGGTFGAGAGYDMASGLGSPIGSALPAELCSHSGSGGSTINLTNPGPQTTTVGSAVSLQVQASDSGSGAVLSYSASGLPAGLAIDPATGLISGVPARAGSSTAIVTASDTGGASRSVSFTWTITLRSSTASVACSPSSLAVGDTTTCTATISDAGAVSSPSGTVRFTSNVYGGFSGGGTCTLAQASLAASRCSITYVPASAGAQWISVAYWGDAQHGSSSASASLGVSAPTVSPASQGTPARPPATAPSPAGPKAGDVLTCPGGRPRYEWTRDGALIAGATSARYVVKAIDEGTTLRCVARIAGAAAAGHPGASSASFNVPVPVVPGCPAAAGHVAGAAFGLLRLGMTRQQARRAYAHSRDAAGPSRDTFCLTPIGITVGYGHGRVVWIATGSAHYAVNGVRVGSALPRRLKPGKGIAVGHNRWYVMPAGAQTILVDIKGGVVQQIGIAAGRITRSRAAQRALLRSL